MSKEGETFPLKPVNSRFTDHQWRAIYDVGSNFLISASAGSGKTTVLVKRVIEKIKNGTNIHELLVVTYTEAAAQEMKDRIQKALQESITQEIDSTMKQHLIRQLVLLPTANISTLHAFCLQVIRRFYYLVQLDPVFRLLTDETEIALLKESVWEELRETLYGEEKERFYQLTENFSNDHNDEGLSEVIFSLYEFARANPVPSEWLAQLQQLYSFEGTLTNSALYQKHLSPLLEHQIDYVLAKYRKMLERAEAEQELQKLAGLLREEYFKLQEFHEKLMTNQLEELYTCVNQFEFFRYPVVKRTATDEVKNSNQVIKELRESSKDIIKEWQATFFAFSYDKTIENLKSSEELVMELAEVGKRFEKAYSERKMDQRLVDFNDLEHLTLQVLTQNKNNEIQPSEASHYYRQRFSEILVDEYQDINRLQESILFWLSHPESEQGNLFMVGDVKQSIYSFRLADPSLFIEKFQAYRQEKNGKRIILSENFRSRSEVLDFTNLIFSQLLDEEVGQIDYNDGANLVTGFLDFPMASGYQPEVLIYESGTDKEVESEHGLSIEDHTEGELRVVAQKIQTLIQQKFLIYDKEKKKTRPVEYRDIVLLTPTKKNNMVVLDIFKEKRIPLRVNDTQNYFQATEIRLMIALLQIIDNPYQDIPFVATLRSPMVGLQENELTYIRLHDQEGTFYDAFQVFLRKDPTLDETSQFPELRTKLVIFSEDFTNWRELARRNELVHLIWTIYQETGFLDYVGGLPAGKQRQANLHALYRRAANYEKMSFKGLFQFIHFIEKMQQKDKDLAEPTTIAEDENAVRVMTIHGSKGLEFPIVFILDLTKQFNLSDIRKRYIFDENLGVGIQFLDTTQRTLSTTLPFLIMKQKRKQKLLEEEMRKLYVALTRSEEKLYLVGSYKSEKDAWHDWTVDQENENLVLSNEARLNSLHLMKWIGMSLVRHSSARPFERNTVLASDRTKFAIHFFNKEDLATDQLQPQFKGEEPIIAGENLVDEKEKKWALDLLNYKYPNTSATVTTSYQSVTEIKRVFEDPDEAQLVKLDLTQTTSQRANRFAEDRLATPNFIEETTVIKGSEVGTGTHLLLQQMPLDQTPTSDSLDKLKRQLIENKALREPVAKKIPNEMILNFFTTAFGQKLLREAEHVKKEQPFSMLLKAEELFHNYSNQTDDILVHGIIDGYLESKDELILYDFKTDHFNLNQGQFEIQRAVQRYQGQMNLYRKALEKVRGRKVTKCYLILLSIGEVIEL